MEIYTDGACHPNPGNGGWAFVVYEGGNEIHHEAGSCENVTNNQMEAEAICRALEWLRGRQATVYTDSQYCQKALTIWHRKWQRNGWKKGPKAGDEPVKNADYWRRALAVMGKAKILWCRGHSGIVGNERADALCSYAMERGFVLQSMHA
ncbi:MAG: ribonuclease H family protein [Casimicrobium sp.]